MSIELQTLPEDKQRLVAGISGGVDSMVLLHLLTKSHHEVLVAHVNYKTRNPGSDEDQKLVEKVCKRMQIPFRVKIADQKNAEGNFQHWARNQRYTFFEELCEEYEARLVLGHHADDLLETQLLKLARGESFLSSSGFSQKNTCYPLLHVSKDELYDFARKENILFNEDQSNAIIDYDRNFLRHQIIPKLKERFPNLLHHASILKKSSEGFNESVALQVNELTEDGTLNREKWLNLPDKLRPLVFSKWVLEECGESLSHAQLASLDQCLNLETGQRWTVNEQWSVIRDRDDFVCVKADFVQKEFETVEIDSFPHRTEDFSFELDSPKTMNDLLSTEHLWIAGESLSDQKKWNQVILRNWKDGDYMQPLGMEGTKKIKNILTDEKVPSQLKKRALVLEIDNEIAACLFPSEKSDKIGIIGELFRCNLNQSAIKITRL